MFLLRVVLVVVLEEVVETVEFAVVPDVGEVCGGTKRVDSLEVLVVLFAGFCRLRLETEPHAPLVQELSIKHRSSYKC